MSGYLRGKPNLKHIVGQDIGIIEIKSTETAMAAHCAGIGLSIGRLAEHMPQPRRLLLPAPDGSVSAGFGNHCLWWFSVRR